MNTEITRTARHKQLRLAKKSVDFSRIDRMETCAGAVCTQSFSCLFSTGGGWP
jgi:hypothetical protein